MKKPLPPSKKTASYRAYKRDLRWQIIFPMVITALIFVAISVGAATREASTASLWADISTIWLLIPLMFFALINLIILAALIYGLAKLLEITPTYTQKLYGFVCLIGEKLEAFADSAAKPIFKVEGFSASVRRIFRQK